ncbi:MAG: hypothetical protein LBQ03_00585 [Puniceicoccales bacterium]|jgi:hypothetical protein|nr:hypothetical protein [Puniceicoccales bacterium]
MIGGSSFLKASQSYDWKNRQKIESILDKEWGNYKNWSEVPDDLKELEEAYKVENSGGRINSSFARRIYLKLGEIKKVTEASSLKAVIDSVQSFINELQENLRRELQGDLRRQFQEEKLQRKLQEKLQKKLQEIYQNQGSTNTGEEDFYENVIFLRKVSHLILNEDKEKLKAINEIVKETNFGLIMKESL